MQDTLYGPEHDVHKAVTQCFPWICSIETMKQTLEFYFVFI